MPATEELHLLDEETTDAIVPLAFRPNNKQVPVTG